MAKKFELIPREESKKLYEWNTRKNEVIAACFETSKLEKWTVSGENFAPADKNRVFNCRKTAKIPYGETTTLGKSGCAVFTTHQGLRLKRGTNIKISKLAAEIAGKGYYCNGKGTYHCLFDHLGCKRAENLQDLLDYLATTESPVATLLVKNSIYFGRNTGRHFVNAVGITNVGFIIDDSESPTRQTISFDKIIAACDVAWLW